MKILNSILLLCISLGAIAQNNSVNGHSNNYLSLELDPAPFILGGYSVSLKLSPAKLPHLTFMGSAYSSKFPDNMMNKPNYEKGFRSLKINTSYAFFVDYYTGQNRSGLHFGPSVFLYSKSVSARFSPAIASFSSIYPNIRVGYLYRPFIQSGFYLNPWFNYGKELFIGDGNTLEGVKFLSNTTSYILAIHLGYQIAF
jgi:hypothetical protein